MLGIFFTNILDTKIVNYQRKLDLSCFMPEKSRSVWQLMVSLLRQAFFNSLLSKMPDCGSPYIPLDISMQIYPFLSLSAKSYKSIDSWVINLMVILVYSFPSSGVHRQKFFSFTHANRAPGVDITEFHIILDFVRSAGLVVISYRYLIRLPPSVILALLGSFFHAL